MKLKFPRQIVLMLLITVGLAYYPLLKFTSEYCMFAVQIGAIIMTLNALAGYAAIEKSFHKKDSVFFTYIFGGILIRLFFLAGILLLLIKFFHIHVTGLISSMFFYYIIYTILEIVYIQKKIAATKHHS